MNYRMRGMGADSGVTTTPLQGVPLATVSPYAAPACGWGQKTVGNGPFTCQFDAGTALQQAWYIPSVYLGMVPGIGSLPPNALSALAWGGLAYYFFGRGGSKRGR